MPRNRAQPVAVITGASSGVGRATALESARRGTGLVLAVRRQQDLHEVAKECRAFAIPALTFALDVTDEDAVRNLAATTFKHFGHLDIWVNNAIVGLYGDFEVIPSRDFRRTIETNFFGYIYGARAALPYFRGQARGVLVNVASVLGEFAIPHMSSYVAAKHAIVGFSDALRQELRGTGIRVCTILPSSIDTPFYTNAGNYIGREIRPVPPVFDPRKVAISIANAIESDRDRVFVPSAAVLLPVARAIFPALTERIAHSIIDRFQIGSRRVSSGSGNLYAPLPHHDKVAGGRIKYRREGLSRWGVLASAAVALATAMTLNTRVKWRERQGSY
jgi:short-subunit dehydrogenase